MAKSKHDTAKATTSKKSAKTVTDPLPQGIASAQSSTALPAKKKTSLNKKGRKDK